ncbi:hypothetical protein PVK06_009013 [Gossypium arboreum]|uniref:Uncharacterized protein n=1 Tax=Gossypium arboreum TaxID=29729 RepID=A0ABR0QLM4_GOSAR|nr:hypothetical protein PVK06_009013 [Gossypium arboreum]
MPKFLVFPITLLPFPDAVYVPTQLAAKVLTQPGAKEPTQTVVKEPKKMTSLTSITTQDRDIDRMIDELIETDKEGEEMIPKKRKWWYKVNVQKSTCRAE